MKYKTIVTVLITIVLFGCGVNETTIRQWGRRNDSDRLIRYIQKNYSRENRVDLVKVAIKQLLKNVDYVYTSDRRKWNFLYSKFGSGFNEELVRQTLLAYCSRYDKPAWQVEISWQFDREEYAQVQEILRLAVELEISRDERIPIAADLLHSITLAKMKEDGLLGQNLKMKTKEIIGTCQSIGVTVEGKPAKEMQEAIDKGEFDSKFT